MSEPANPLSSWSTAQSPFASVIGTNHAPSTAELKSLKELLIHPQHELSRMETEIDRVQTLLNSLLSEKQKIKEYIEAHRALASPVRQIPPETLSEIFIQCLPTEPSYPVRDMNEAPLLLTTVCRHWRIVSLNTPLLWNSLHLFLPPHLSSDVCSRRVAGAKLWLKRSGSLPLFISFLGNVLSSSRGPQMPNSDYSAIPRQNMESMIRLLMPFSNRFRDLSLSLTSETLAIFDNFSIPLFPVLVSLRVTADFPTTGLPMDQQFAALMSRMPLLKKLHVGSFLLSYKDYRALPCNWRNLINLVIEDCLSRSQLLSILAETPRIQSVSLAMFVGQEDSTFQASMVHLHDLSELRLTVQLWHTLYGQPNTVLARSEKFQTEISSFIDCIQCSPLRLFSFTSVFSEVLLLQWPFTGLPLQTLEILELTAPILPNALMECLSQTPKLISFHFTTIWHEFPLLDRHLSTITFSADQPAPLWPRLENIQLLTSTAMFHSAGSYLDNILRVRDEELQTLQKELESITSFTSGALTRFLESRSQTKLKTCDVFYPTKREPSFSEAELETLRELQRKGLKLRIHCITSHAGIDVHRDLPHGGLPVVFPDMESGFFGNEVIL